MSDLIWTIGDTQINQRYCHRLKHSYDLKTLQICIGEKFEKDGDWGNMLPPLSSLTPEIAYKDPRNELNGRPRYNLADWERMHREYTRIIHEIEHWKSLGLKFVVRKFHEDTSTKYNGPEDHRVYREEYTTRVPHTTFVVPSTYNTSEIVVEGIYSFGSVEPSWEVPDMVVVKDTEFIPRASTEGILNGGEARDCIRCTMTDGSIKELLFYGDEIGFSCSELKNLTWEEIQKLYTERDKAYIAAGVVE